VWGTRRKDSRGTSLLKEKPMDRISKRLKQSARGHSGFLDLTMFRDDHVRCPIAVARCPIVSDYPMSLYESDARSRRSREARRRAIRPRSRSTLRSSSPSLRTRSILNSRMIPRRFGGWERGFINSNGDSFRCRKGGLKMQISGIAIARGAMTGAERTRDRAAEQWNDPDLWRVGRFGQSARHG
jgi:hypothetical protein